MQIWLRCTQVRSSAGATIPNSFNFSLFFLKLVLECTLYKDLGSFPSNFQGWVRVKFRFRVRVRIWALGRSKWGVRSSRRCTTVYGIKICKFLTGLIFFGRKKEPRYSGSREVVKWELRFWFEKDNGQGNGIWTKSKMGNRIIQPLLDDPL